jgi:rare lipoprotein A
MSRFWIVLGHFVGPLVILGFACAWLLSQPLVGRAEAAETCRGRWVNASWYGSESGSRTASGLRFDGSQWLVAHKTLPFHTKLRLTYRGKSVTVPVLDRGPYIKGREIDLSSAVANALGTKRAGVARICMERVK